MAIVEIRAITCKNCGSEAVVKYQVKNWKDLSQLPVSKQTEIETHKTPKVRVTKTKVSLRNPILRTSRVLKPSVINLGAGIVQSRGRRHIRL